MFIIHPTLTFAFMPCSSLAPITLEIFAELLMPVSYTHRILNAIAYNYAKQEWTNCFSFCLHSISISFYGTHTHQFLWARPRGVYMTFHRYVKIADTTCVHTHTDLLTLLHVLGPVCACHVIELQLIGHNLHRNGSSRCSCRWLTCLALNVFGQQSQQQMPELTAAAAKHYVTINHWVALARYTANRTRHLQVMQVIQVIDIEKAGERGCFRWAFEYFDWVIGIQSHISWTFALWLGILIARYLKLNCQGECEANDWVETEESS